MKLVCVVGPTGCGKTWLGVELAKMLGGEVVSCDSMQIYRGMVIGTAAPTAEEMQGIPHHMVGVADPRENYSVARYADDAAKCVDDILSRGNLLGVVPEDPQVMLCANRGEPLILAASRGAAVAYLNIAKRLLGQRSPLMKLK